MVPFPHIQEQGHLSDPWSVSFNTSFEVRWRSRGYIHCTTLLRMSLIIISVHLYSLDPYIFFMGGEEAQESWHCFLSFPLKIGILIVYLNMVANMLSNLCKTSNLICCSVTQSCPILCDPMGCSTSGFPALHWPLEFAQTHVRWVGDVIQPSHPLLLLTSIFPSIRVFSYESALCIRWPKYWRFIFSISPPNEHSGLISFRIDWFDLLAVQRTLKSLLNTTIWKHQFFSAQPSLWFDFHIHAWSLEKPQFWIYGTLSGKWCLCF